MSRGGRDMAWWRNISSATAAVDTGGGRRAQTAPEREAEGYEKRQKNERLRQAMHLSLICPPAFFQFSSHGSDSISDPSSSVLPQRATNTFLGVSSPRY